jgi:hypothetical protein
MLLSEWRVARTGFPPGLSAPHSGFFMRSQGMGDTIRREYPQANTLVRGNSAVAHSRPSGSGPHATG